MRRMLFLLLGLVVLLAGCSSQSAPPHVESSETAPFMEEAVWHREARMFITCFLEEHYGLLSHASQEIEPTDYLVSDELAEYLEYSAFIGIAVYTDTITVLEEKEIGELRYYHFQLSGENGSATLECLVKRNEDKPVFYDFYGGYPMCPDEMWRGENADITADPYFWTSTRCEALLEQARKFHESRI